MKSLFPYLVLIILFIAGIRLVNRQQQYARSILEPTTVEQQTALSGILAVNVTKTQPVQLGLHYIETAAIESFRRARTITTTSLTSAGKQHKRLLYKSTSLSTPQSFL